MSADYSIMDSYSETYPVLQSVAAELEKYLKESLSGVERIDTITARAKDPERYFSKAVKQNDDGSAKYDNPKFQIQDQIGARINVFFLSDVERIKQHVLKYLKFIEMQLKTPERDAEFGYFGLHFIARVPDDVIDDGLGSDVVPEFFELQIKTLFQHAWSEAHHDIGYKTVVDLDSEQRRKLAFTAAQAWGADTIYEDLLKTLITAGDESSDR
jgi:ppGpp synthetase/RelA/SpoT-type nucleotidyltranferase